MDVQTLKDLGLDKAAEQLETKLTLKNKLAVAYEHYSFVEPATLECFEKQLKEKTHRIVRHDKYIKTEYWRALKFVDLKDYANIPPADCLLDLKKAKDLGCFDSFQVAFVEEVSNYSDSTPTPDPIIFGSIMNCQDSFFITQWDDDVSIEEILAAKEVR